MGCLRFLFSYAGRTSRNTYLLFFTVAVGLTLGYLAAAYSYLTPTDIGAELEGDPYHGIPPKWVDRLVIASAIGAAASEILMFFAALALTARRLHDRGKSGWWMIVLLFGTWGFDYLSLSINYACAATPLPLYGLFDFLSLDIACKTLPFAETIVMVLGVRVPLAGALAALIAIGFTLWSFVELAVMAGMKGANRFGPDPLGPPRATD